MKSPLIDKGISDCWNYIGIFGDGTCVELEKHHHCRNCPVYSYGGRTLLERRPPEGYREEWTEVLKTSKQERATGDISVVVFRIGSERLALITPCCKEITEPRFVHRLPHSEGTVLQGLVNIRGEIQLCMSLKNLLKIEEDSMEQALNKMAYRRMLVGEKEGERWVFAVDEVYGIVHFDSKDLQNVPATVAKTTPAFTKGIFYWNEKQIGFLDEEILFYSLKKSV